MVVSIEQDHIFPFVEENITAMSDKLQPWFAAMSSEMFRAMEQRLGYHMSIVAAANLSGVSAIWRMWQHTFVMDSSNDLSGCIWS